MTTRVWFKPEAEWDLGDAHAWYESECPVIEDGVRRALVHRFPYGIFYRQEGKTIVVLSVFHGARDPQTWRDRT